ncbi:ABC transporter substrate-binding protein [Nocardioides hungaricus]
MSKKLIATSAALALLTSGCAFGKDSAADSSGGDRPRLALVSALASISYYTTMNCGAQAAAKEFGVDVTYEAPKAFDAAEQQQILQSLLVKGLDGLIVVPADSSALNATLAQTAQDMPVMTTDLAPSEQIGLASISSDGREGGALAADYMAEQLKGTSGKVLVLANSPTITPVVDRAQGFIDRMAKIAPNIEVLPIEYSGGEPSDAAKIVGNTLRANDDLVGVFATFQPSVFGTMSAFNGNSEADDIVVVGYDGDPAEVDALKAGDIDALVIQTPYEMGYQAVKQMSEVLAGDVEESAIDYQQTTPVVLATADNLSDPEVDKYLYTNDC